METNTSPKSKLRGALTRALVALLIAVFLLVATNFAIIDILRGPKELGPVAQDDLGSYVSTEVSVIMDFYAEDYSPMRNTVTGWYAIVPHNGKLLTVLLTPRYFESAGLVIDDTYSYINGLIDGLDKYFIIHGTLDNLELQAQEMLHQWFSMNKDWMEEAGIIGEVTDFSQILSPYVLRADRVGSLSAAWVLILNGAALLCLVYIFIVFVRYTLGKYDDKPEDTAQHGGDMPGVSRALPFEPLKTAAVSPDSGEGAE
ncbi:MAG: DUF6709 family protein [Oscillospiraceae bacterium]|jgi:hypothetical protein